MKEIHRFKSAMNSSAENGVIRTYIETMLEMRGTRREKIIPILHMQNRYWRTNTMDWKP